MDAFDPAALEVIRAEEARDAERRARRVFQRTLAAWTSDLLRLRRAGVLTERWTDAVDDGVRLAA